MTSPIASSGTVTSRSMIGSSRIGRAFASASLKPIDAAILNAISDESTSWYPPSKSVTRKSTTGEAVRMPRGMASRIPFSTAGMYWRGTEPPTISSTNSKPAPRASGSILIQVSANWPRPPDCFLSLPWASARPLIVSR